MLVGLALGAFRMRHLFVAAVLAASAGHASHSHAASFDCSKAVTPGEKAVCASPRLSGLDTLLGQAHAKALTASKTDKDDTRRLRTLSSMFMHDRNACGDGAGCILAVYLNYIQGYQQLGSDIDLPDDLTATEIAGGAPKPGLLPKALGDCASTSIVEIGPRLGGNVAGEDGVSIDLANHGSQVTYFKDLRLLASRKGDQVVMCLTALPQFCPVGDDRGRVYTVTNLRTHATWSLSDSQHECGGA